MVHFFAVMKVFLLTLFFIGGSFSYSNADSYKCGYQKLYPNTSQYLYTKDHLNSWAPKELHFSLADNEFKLEHFQTFKNIQIPVEQFDNEIKILSKNKILFQIKKSTVDNLRKKAYFVYEVLVFKESKKSSVELYPTGYADMGKVSGSCLISAPSTSSTPPKVAPSNLANETDGVVQVPVAFTVGESGPFMGKLEYPNKAAQAGDLQFKGGVEIGDCSGKWQRKGNNFGVWYASCNNGLSASGSYEMTGPAKGSGEGVDSKGRQIKLTIGY
jgi:hypothetical protein